MAMTVIASFDVDAQYTFTPVCPDELPVPGGDEIATALNQQAALAQLRVGSKDAHTTKAVWVATDDKPMLSPVEKGGANVDIHWPAHAIPGTKGFELLAGLPRPADYDFFVWKGIEPDMHPYGACYHDLAETLSTGVIEFLQSRNVTHIIVGGLALEYCVKTTALQLAKTGSFKVIVNLDACRGIEQSAIDAAVEELNKAGCLVVANQHELINVLENN
jgi:nicotinamidase/pyrazinamidase